MIVPGQNNAIYRSYAVEVHGTSDCSLNGVNRPVEHVSKALLPLIISARPLSVPNRVSPMIDQCDAARDGQQGELAVLVLPERAKA